MRVYLLLALGLVLDNTVGAFVGGTLAGAGRAALVAVWVLAVVLDLVQDLAMYGVGVAARRPGLLAHADRFGLHEQRRERLLTAAREHPVRLLLFAKLVDVGAVPAYLAAGVAGVGWVRFLVLDAVLTVARVGVLVGAGALVGDRWAAPLRDLLADGWLTAAVGAGLLVLALAGRAVLKRVVNARGS